MSTAKKSGSSAWRQRKPTLHGSSAKRGMAKHAGTLRRLGEKPGGRRKPQRTREGSDHG
jgi:hypothetical protein